MKRILFIIALLLIPKLARAQGALLPDFMQQYSNNLGVPLASGFVCSTISGTATNLATYPTQIDASNGTNANANPVALDATGRATIWLGTGTYRIVLLNPVGIGSGTCNGTATGSAIKTVDGVAGFGSLLVGSIFWTQINHRVFCSPTAATFSAAYTAAVALQPATGGIVDCSNLQGNQTIASDVFTGVSKPILLVWPVGTVTSSVSMTIPVTTTIDFPEGGILTLAAATTATINGEIKGTESQHFAGTGNVVFGTLSSSAKISPKWFGAKCDGSTDDAAALNATTASLVNGGTVLFPFGVSCKVTSATWVTSKSNITVDQNNSEILYDGANVSGNDRAILVHTGDSNLGALKNVGIVASVASVTAGAVVFVAAVTADATALVAGDWLMLQETDAAEGGDAVLFDWAQVLSVSGANINVVTPFRTAFPGTHSTPQFRKVSNVTKNVTFKNGRCRTTANTNFPCYFAGVARGVTFENLIASPFKGNPFASYRTQGLTLINVRATTNNGQVTEFSDTVDLSLSNSQFTCEGSSPGSSAFALDFGTAFFSIIGNQVACSANLATLFTATHDGVVSGNAFGYVVNAGIGNTQAISALGSQRIVYVGNTFAGGAGAASVGVSLGDSSGWTKNISSTGNWVIASNPVTGFVTPVNATTSDVVISQPITGTAQATNGILLGSAPASVDTLTYIRSVTESQLPIHWETVGVGNWYAGPDAATASKFSIDFNTTNAGTFVVDSAGTSTTLGSLVIGSTATASSPILHHWSNSASLDFAAWSGADCQDLTMTVTGANNTDTVEIGVDTTLASTAGVQFTGFVSSLNTVTVRGCKITAGASANPAALTVRADVWRHNN